MITRKSKKKYYLELHNSCGEFMCLSEFFTNKVSCVRFWRDTCRYYSDIGFYVRRFINHDNNMPYALCFGDNKDVKVFVRFGWLSE